ncbi:MAG: hypothetical protein WBW51_10505 [Methyloceanibacter sp.]
MRLVFSFVLAGCISLPLALGGGNASAGIVCGNFDGKFTCRNDSGAAKQFGKNATPGAPINQTSPEAPAGDALPPAGGGWSTDQGTAAGTSDAAGCQHGMVGTPPNCRCPKNSELLGGNCVHYTASACSAGLASDAVPQACRSAEEKVSCTMRQDGLKDCCCVTYDKF